MRKLRDGIKSTSVIGVIATIGLLASACSTQPAPDSGGASQDVAEPAVAVSQTQGAAPLASTVSVAPEPPAPLNDRGPASAVTGDGFWVVSTGGQSVPESIAEMAPSESQEFRDRASEMADGWRERIQSGESVKGVFSSGTSKNEKLAEISTLLSALSSEPIAQAAVDPSNPNTFPVRGHPGDGKLHWEDLKYELVVKHCDDPEHCEITDEWKTKGKVDPGATVSRVTGTNLYFPSQGHLQQVHFQMFAVCRGAICADQNTGGLPEPKSIDYLRDYGRRNDNVLTVAPLLWAWVTVLNRWMWEGIKTADATCEPEHEGNACRYQ